MAFYYCQSTTTNTFNVIKKLFTLYLLMSTNCDVATIADIRIVRKMNRSDILTFFLPNSTTRSTAYKVREEMFFGYKNDGDESSINCKSNRFTIANHIYYVNEKSLNCYTNTEILHGKR